MIRMVAADNMRLEKLAADQEVIMQRMKLEKTMMVRAHKVELRE
jgi:hypothetical protein